MIPGFKGKPGSLPLGTRSICSGLCANRTNLNNKDIEEKEENDKDVKLTQFFSK